MKNRIRKAREDQHLSMEELAEHLGIESAHLPYIEAGRGSVKVQFALRAATALRRGLIELFPEAEALLGAEPITPEALIERHYDSDALRAFERAGIDLDPATWTLKMRLRGGAELELVCSSDDAARFRRALLSRDPSTPFFVFDSSRVCVAVNLDHLLHCHVLWDVQTPFDWHDKDLAEDGLTVVLADSAETYTFGVEQDEFSDGDDEDADLGEFEALIYGLDTLVEPDEVINFIDADGEYAYFRASDVALLSIPLPVLVPGLGDALFDFEAALAEKD